MIHTQYFNKIPISWAIVYMYAYNMILYDLIFWIDDLYIWLYDTLWYFIVELTLIVGSAGLLDRPFNI